MTETLVPAKPGLYIPRVMLEHYNFEQAVVAAALLHLYQQKMGNQGIQIVVPMPELLDLCGGPAEDMEDLKDILATLYLKETIGYRIDDDILCVWFTPELAERLKGYQRPVL